ncbi:MAG: DciA family protein [Actinomycetota bacterium]|nr:DciA family protein [Actinomycetota bacterium]
MAEPTPPDGTSPDQPHDESGLDLARAVARGLAGKTPRRRRTSRDRPARRTEVRMSDDRDPQTLDASIGRFVAEQGWGTELRVHGVFSRWEALVGPEVGQHAKPESYADGRLVIRTDSTAWGTQMRLLAPDLVRRVNEELGEETVRMIEVLGPRSPSWVRGRFRVKGRGPRDTYG